MKRKKVKIGLQVKIIKVTPAFGFLVGEEHLKARRSDDTGVITGWVPGHGGDVWWVRHPDGHTGAYMFTEFEPIEY